MSVHKRTRAALLAATIAVAGLPFAGNRAGLTVPRCSAMIAAAEPRGVFDGCGDLIQGVECVLFDADSGGLWVLSNYGGYQVGDRVRVVGILDLNCITICMQGDGCILDNCIGPCGPGNPCCPADVNGDGMVDVVDLLELLAAWGDPGGPADINGDGIVDVSDLLELLAAWGPCPLP